MNFEDIVVKSSPGLCRCCLSEDCYKDLGTEYSWMNETEIYADMLLNCLDIRISQHDDGPNGPKRLICEVCITRLRDACNFKKQVLESEKKFIEMLNRGDFMPKVIMVEEVKQENLDNTENEYLTDVELENMVYCDTEEQIRADDPLTSYSTASKETGRKPKRGRPRKQAQMDKPAKIAKIAKGDDEEWKPHEQTSADSITDDQDSEKAKTRCYKKKSVRTIEEIRRRKREAEKRRRDRIRADPLKKAEHKAKEKLRRQRRKDAKKDLSIADLSKTAQRLKRKMWRESSERYRKNKKSQEKLLGL